eukprot:754104-Hanusia_phi.AAC.4
MGGKGRREGRGGERREEREGIRERRGGERRRNKGNIYLPHLLDNLVGDEVLNLVDVSIRSYKLLAHLPLVQTPVEQDRFPLLQ